MGCNQREEGDPLVAMILKGGPDPVILPSSPTHLCVVSREDVKTTVLCPCSSSNSASRACGLCAASHNSLNSCRLRQKAEEGAAAGAVRVSGQRGAFQRCVPIPPILEDLSHTSSLSLLLLCCAAPFRL